MVQLMCSLYFCLSLLSMYPTNNGQGPHSSCINNVKKSNLQLYFLVILTKMTSVVQASTNRIICLVSVMVFGLLGWPDGQMTNHVTLLLHKQLIQFDAPSIGTALDYSYFYLCFDFESLIGCQIMSHLWYHWNSSYFVYLHVTWV